MDKDAQKVQTMFDELAPRYDLMNRVMTLGMDQRWRKFAVKKSIIQPGHLVLDLAAGTGDIAFAIQKLHPDATVIAGDFSIGMLIHGRKRSNGEKLHWIACDAMRLPFADNCLDAVIFGYLLRNVANLTQTLAEINRVLKPGGRIVCLDTTPPSKSILSPLIKLYMKLGLRFFAKAVGTDPTGANYRYLFESTLNFLPAPELAKVFEQAGFSNVGYKTLNFKTIAIHWGHKPV